MNSHLSCLRVIVAALLFALFNMPLSGQSAGTAGLIGQITTTNPRLIQLASKYMFRCANDRRRFDRAGYALSFSRIAGRSGGAAPFNSLSFS